MTSDDVKDLLDLASERLGGAAVFANDEFFAPKEALVLARAPVFEPDRYTERGKWMDGWETRRRREPGHDRAIVRLGAPGIIHGVVVDTTHFRGNHPEACSLEGVAVEGHPDPDALDAMEWTPLVPRTELRGDSPNEIPVASRHRFTHVRLHIYPDGGVARLRVRGEALAPLGRLARGGWVDLAAAEHGGRVVGVSDEFFASHHNLVLPGPARNMGDGWETRRRREPGHDYVVLRLAAPGVVRRVVLDTSFYKGNAPGRVSLEGARLEGPLEEAEWIPLLPETGVLPDTVHHYQDELLDTGPVTHVRLCIFPDGGVARLRLFAHMDDEALAEHGLRFLGAMLPGTARGAFLGCCGSSRFADAMAEGLPYESESALLGAAGEAWAALEPEDWLEAFRAHPRLGGEKAEKNTGAASEAWSRSEQASMRDADARVTAALAEKNRAYEARFGFIFILCATGKSPEEMLTALTARLENDRDAELAIASAEQHKITRLRLAKLLRT